MKNLLIFLLLPFTSLAQKDCVIKTIVDEFTQETTIQTEYFRIDGGMSSRGNRAKALLVFRDGNYFLVLHALADKVLSVSENDPLHLKFTDGSVMTLSNLNFTISSMDDSYFFLTVSYIGIRLMFPLTAEQVQELVDKDLEKSRLTTSKGFMEFEILSKKIRSAIRDCASAFQSKIQKD